MTTIAEKTAALPQLIDDVASAATSLSEWSDADPNVTNDAGANGEKTMQANGRVLEHGPSGMFVLLYLYSNSNVDNNDHYYSGSGIRVVHSTDWDTENSVPAGSTTVMNGDPFSGQVGNHRNASFSSHSTSYGFDQTGHSVLVHKNNLPWQAGADDDTDLWGLPTTYFASVGPGWLNIGAWDAGTNRGSASFYGFEYVDNKFWNDGNQPWAAFSSNNLQDGGDSHHAANASWKAFSGQTGGEQSQVYGGSGFDRSQWGHVNPASDDDTYFFRRPTMYQTSSQSVPVAYISNLIGNDVNEGGAHGDTITHDGITYQVFRQSGNARSQTITAGLRYE